MILWSVVKSFVNPVGNLRGAPRMSMTSRSSFSRILPPSSFAFSRIASSRSKIAFASTRDGDWEVYLMNADGTGQTRLTTYDAGDRRPAWSPW